MCQAVPNKKSRPRTRILAAAKDAFEVQGFEGTNLRSIAQASGMATGTIFVHFRDKRVQLHAALFEDLAQTLHDVLATPRDPSLEQWLERLTDQLLTYYESRPVLSRVLRKESLLVDLPWSERFAAPLAELHAGVAAREEFSRDPRKFKASLDAQLFAAAYVSFSMFALLSWAQHAHPDPRAVVKHLVAQQLAGFKAKAERKS